MSSHKTNRQKQNSYQSTLSDRYESGDDCMEEDGPAAREHDLGPEELPRQHADPGPELTRIARHDPRPGARESVGLLKVPVS